MLSKLNQALWEVQETVRANESLRGENAAMATELDQLRAHIESDKQTNAKFSEQEQSLLETKRHNLHLETENQLLKQRL